MNFESATGHSILSVNKHTNEKDFSSVALIVFGTGKKNSCGSFGTAVG
jgi:hypothetical protein